MYMYVYMVISRAPSTLNPEPLFANLHRMFGIFPH